MMHIPLIEPVSPRYIHINSVTNQVHLLVPVVGGLEISTDNTCKSTVELREFFDGGALRELNAYKDKLEFDIGLFKPGSSERALKEARLLQIETYIKTIPAMQYRYANSLTSLLQKPSNLYTIQLRPREPDYQSNVVNPIFNIERGTNSDGEPISSLYRAMYDIFPTLDIVNQDPQTQLTKAVLDALPHSPSFIDIQQTLQEKCKALFDLNIDFTEGANGRPVTMEFIDNITGLAGNERSPEAYIHALLGVCAMNLWVSLSTPPFYGISAAATINQRTEDLSILTQFFLASLNVYCQTKGISSQNFGVILDTNPQLSKDLVLEVSQALTAGSDVEQTFCDFFNTHSGYFQLTRSLTQFDVDSVKEKFQRYWRTISTGENAHMDDFMILDTEATKATSKFVTHQGSICVNFAEIVSSDLPNQNYFREVRDDFKDYQVEIPNGNEFIAGILEITPEELLARIKDDQFEKLPAQAREALRAHPGFQLRHFLNSIARGNQQEAQALLDKNAEVAQDLLSSGGIFTDYSGRTFNCTAYEYAYWAKDTHMCRVLESYMNQETKAQILARIEEMEHIDGTTGEIKGLEYAQYGVTCSSAHFDFIPLIKALQKYVDNYDEFEMARYWDLIESDWEDVAREQRNAPAHVVQEYCRRDRSFDSNPQFKEATFPRDLVFYNLSTGKDESWFPLTTKPSVALMRGKLGSGAAADTKVKGWIAALDLRAIINLNIARIAELKPLREHLSPTITNHDSNLSP